MASALHPRPWRRRMLGRVVRYGVLLLAAAAIAFAIIAGLALRTVEPDTHGIVAWMGARACEAKASSDLKQFPVQVTVYSAGGEVVASNVTPPLSAQEGSFGLRRSTSFVSCNDLQVVSKPADLGDRYAVMQRPEPLFGLAAMALAFLGVFVIVLLASIPLARSIASPIEQISRSADEFGKGDLTSRTQIASEDEIGDLGRAFNQMADRITVLLRQERDLLANVSHELRTPLARIRVLLEDAQEAPSRSKAALCEIARDLSDLERIVDDLLDAVRLEAGKVPNAKAEFVLRRERVIVSELFDTSVERFRRSHPERRVTVQIDSRRSEPLALNGDAALLLRVIDNLLENAWRYSDEPAAIHLRARALETMSADRPEHRIEFEVQDHGIGIEPSDLPRVCTPFFRGDRSRTRATGGVGLGLSICQRIIEAHGGTLSLRSVVDQGTTVAIVLPQSTP
jgi:signal transduction histidine kinase